MFTVFTYWADEDDVYPQEFEAETKEEALEIAADCDSPTIEDELGCELMVDGILVDDYEETREKLIEQRAEIAAKEAARLATYGDEEDVANIDFIVNYFNGYAPLTGWTAQYAATRMYEHSGWNADQEFGGHYRIKAPSGRMYEMRITRSKTINTINITRTL